MHELLTALAEASSTGVSLSTPAQYGALVGGAVTVVGGAWAIMKFLFARIEASHQEHVSSINETIKREQERADKAERRADQYEAELKMNVKVWFEQVSPAMAATARAIDTVTDELRRSTSERRRRE